MTRVRRAQVQCMVCATESQQTVLLSSNTGGAPELDGRPAEMLRGTMSMWVQRCPRCGYCAQDTSIDQEYDLPVAPLSGHDGIWIKPEQASPELSAAEPDRRDRLRSIVNSEQYRAQLGDKRLPDLANSFLCQALLDEAEGRYVDATFAALHAAWTCDDARKPDQARECRVRAIGLIQNVSRGTQSFGIRLRSREALLADAQRRSGDFDGARAACEAALADETDTFLRSLLRFQLELVNRRDVAAHNFIEVIRLDPDAWGVKESAKSQPRPRWWQRWR